MVGGLPPRRDIIYIVSKWWKSPWAIAAYAIILTVIVVWLIHVRHNNKRFRHTIKELRIQKSDIHNRFSRHIKLRMDAARSDDDAQFLNKVNAVIEKEISNPQFTANDFADSMGMGRTASFSRMKAVTGYGPKEYLNLHRIKHAAELISTTTLSIYEVSDRVGISDPLYLSRIFRRHYGCSPTEWRKHTAK